MLLLMIRSFTMPPENEKDRELGDGKDGG